ncbi:hypothetical protein ACERIM_15500 [Natrinema sp. H-ect1]|uniref:hypothetical protein n=1 Tax=Natrinema sp. H-ect1 TaxID=3242700 RepID=UPI00359E6EED
MSANDDEEVPGREIAYRLFAAEYDDASLSYAESDEERAPNYVISPTGARLNRVFAVGTLTEVTSVNEEMVRARVVDPTGAFVVYAGQYQPDELAFLEGVEPPEFVAVTGKARTFQPEDGDQVYTSLRPESIATVDADTRDRWVVSAAEQTLERIGTYAGAADLDADGEDLTDALLEAGVESGLAAGIPLAQDHYGTTPAYLAALRECAREACEVVAGERDQVSGLDLAPDTTSPEYDVSFASLADLDGIDADALESEPAEPMAATAGGSGAATDPDDAHSGSAAGTATETDSGTEDAAIDVDADGTTTDQGETAGVVTEDSSVEDAESETASLEADEPETETAAADTAAPTPDDTGESTSPESNDGDADDDLGDFDAGAMDDGGMYEMDDEEREQLEEEFGAEFTTGSQVEEPGEAEIDVPEPDEPADDPADAPEPDDADAESATTEAGDSDADDGLGEPPESGLEADDASDASEPDAEPEAAVTADESADEAAAETDDTESDAEPADDVDLEDYVVETMEELDDGDGADRTELVEAVADDTGAAPEDVEEAIQDALMGGQCYEPDDETLKAI